MEEACSALEIEFKRVINDLEFASHRIEADSKKNQGNNNCDVLSLVKKIQLLNNKIESLKARAERVKTLRTEIQGPLAEELLNNYKDISNIIEVSGLLFEEENSNNNDHENEWNSAATNVEELHVSSSNTIGNEDSKSGSTAATATMTSVFKIDSNSSNNNSNNNGGIKNDVDEENTAPSTNNKNLNNKNNIDVHGKKPSNKSVHSALNQTAKRWNTTTNNSNTNTNTNANVISLEMFNSVPVSTRSRCTLKQVQNIYNLLVAECTKRQRSSTTIKELSDSRGVAHGKNRFVGRSSDSILATLKSMNLIKTNRDLIVLVKNNHRNINTNTSV